jgi:putative oxidoreductase
MANTVGRVGDVAELKPLAFALLVTRVALGLMYLGHALMMASVLGFEHASHYASSIGLPAWFAHGMTAAELAGAALLLGGLYVRQVAVALMPLLLVTALVHLGTGVGASMGFGVYFLITVAGQSLLAGWQRPAGDGEWSGAYDLENLSK